jgi:3-phenylpropionate/trans-cinnamate dioxygenase ferredoxin reductase subunit
MADRRVDHLLIGGGIASATCARTLREDGAQGSILLVGRELDPPYHRPPVTKGYLQGREQRPDTLIAAESWYSENDVELLTRTSAMGLDLDARVAKLSTKQEVEFGSALLATGAMVRRLTVDGAELEGIHYLRALGNADSLRGGAEEAERVVLVGGSYIACEVAASLTLLGKRCTMVMQESATLERSFGPDAGRFFQGILEEHGVEVLGGEDVERFTGEEGHVRAVATASGREVPADLVVVGVGAQPDVMLARRAGLEIGPLGGVVADARLETATAGVYVAGDMCEWESAVHGRPMRIEHEEVAAAQGATVARNMLGAGAAHAEIPYFFSDLADWASLEYVGPALTWDEEQVRGSFESGEFSVSYLEGGKLRALLSVGRSGDLDEARARIAAGQ